MNLHRATSVLRTDALQSKVNLEGVEIPVVVQQPVPADNAACGQHNVNRAANRDANTSEFSEIACSFNRDVFASENDKLQAR